MGSLMSPISHSHLANLERIPNQKAVEQKEPWQSSLSLCSQTEEWAGRRGEECWGFINVWSRTGTGSQAPGSRPRALPMWRTRRLGRLYSMRLGQSRRGLNIAGFTFSFKDGDKERSAKILLGRRQHLSATGWTYSQDGAGGNSLEGIQSECRCREWPGGRGPGALDH